MRETAVLGKALTFLTGVLFKILNTGENRRFDRCVLDWTNQYKSRLPLVQCHASP